MEEIQSTEILNREILEDARKKALRILKTADDTILSQNTEWEKRTSESLAEMELKYSELSNIAAREIMVRLPIDKRRIKSEKIEKLLGAAAESWYTDLSHTRVLELLSLELAEQLCNADGFITSEKIHVIINGLSEKEALEVFAAACSLGKLPQLTEKFPAQISTKTISNDASHRFPSITLETEDMRITASIQNKIEFLLQEKRAELIEALVGSDFTEE
jgi:hypothetical protein